MHHFRRVLSLCMIFDDPSIHKSTHGSSRCTNRVVPGVVMGRTPTLVGGFFNLLDRNVGRLLRVPLLAMERVLARGDEAGAK